MNLFKASFNWGLYFLLQLLIENSIKFPLVDGNLHFSVSFIFLLNTGLLFIKPNFKVFFILQLISIATFVLALLPHFFFFNIFSFVSRFNYIWLKPNEFVFVLLYILFAIFVIYLIVKAQYNLIKNHLDYSFEFIVLLVLLLSYRVIVKTKLIHRFHISIYLKGVNENKLDLFVDDFATYKKGANAIQNYTCDNSETISPSIRFFSDNQSNKELLMIMESWGELVNAHNQENCINFLNNYLHKSAHLATNYHFEFGRICFHGNTASAEARELLNMDNEESYRAYLEFSQQPKYNLIADKIKAGYHTIASFPASKSYGSNHSNAEGFRKKLRFKSRFYFEELINNKTSTINHENGYYSVYDEDMVDSIMHESKNYLKVFAYGLTINTHSPFNLDMSRVDQKDYKYAKSVLLKSFDNNVHGFDQFYRIVITIKHTLNHLDKDPTLFDKVLFVGDHSYPDLRCMNLYNKEFVPYLVLSKKH
jgi:hypothetical protein